MAIPGFKPVAITWKLCTIKYKLASVQSGPFSQIHSHTIRGRISTCSINT